ncbi:MAG: hypothetical protein LUG47_02835 [Clostridiales bacterium]|nr:hypothetical protein [Clostridiales bacterium]
MERAKTGVSILALLAALLLLLSTYTWTFSLTHSADALSISCYADASASDGESTAYRYVRIGGSTIVYQSHIYNQRTDFQDGSTADYGNGRGSGCGYFVLATAYNLLGYTLNGVDLTTLSYDVALDNMAHAVGVSMGYDDWSYQKLSSLKPKWIDAFLTAQGISHIYYPGDNLPDEDTIRSALESGKVAMMSVSGNPYSNGIHWVLAYGLSEDGSIIYITNSNYGYSDSADASVYGVCVSNQVQYHVLKDGMIYTGESVTDGTLTSHLYTGSTYGGVIIIDPPAWSSEVYALCSPGLF